MLVMKAWSGSAITDDPPAFVSVALAHGSFKGQGLAVGFQMLGEGMIGEGCLIGVELVSLHQGQYNFAASLSFAPMTGRCFMYFPGGHGFVAQALPDLCDVALSEQGHTADAVDAWVHVSRGGSISFFRRSSAEAGLEFSGELPASFFPRDVHEFHASVHFQMAQLASPMTVSIHSRSPDMPPCAQVLQGEEFNAVWGLHDPFGEHLN